MVQVRVRLPKDQVERLRALAAERGVSMAGGELRGLLERWYPWGSISS